MKNPITNWLSLGLDASSAWGSIGLVDGEGVLASTTLRVRGGHGRGLADRVERLLQEAGVSPNRLTSIGVVNGPGSFTALRVGVTSAQALGMGLSIPVVPVSTPRAIIEGLPPLAGRVLVLVPARRGEVFVQGFEHDRSIGWVEQDVVDCRRVEMLGEFVGKVSWLAGPAAEESRDLLEGLFGPTAEPVPLGARTARGETVAWLAHKAAHERPGSFPAERVEIEYLQSHGALTIAQRGGGRSEGESAP